MLTLDARTAYVLGVGRVETGRSEAHKRNAAATKKRKADEKQLKHCKHIRKITEFTQGAPRRKVGMVAKRSETDRCCHGNGPECKACIEAASTGLLTVGDSRLRSFAGEASHYCLKS